MAVNVITTIVTSRKPDMQQCHNATFPGANHDPRLAAKLDN